AEGVVLTRNRANGRVLYHPSPPALRGRGVTKHTSRRFKNTMRNFFEHQAAARRKTGWLMAYYIAAIIGTVLMTYVLLTAIFAVPAVRAGEKFTWFNPMLLAVVAVAVLAVVGGCTAFKVAQLASGGSSVALMMGGREIGGRVSDPSEKRLLNIVEEMALA